MSYLEITFYIFFSGGGGGDDDGGQDKFIITIMNKSCLEKMLFSLCQQKYSDLKE